MILRSLPFLLAPLLLAAPVGTACGVTLSEVLYDASSADDGNVFVELYGPAGLDLGGFSLEGVNGADGAVGPVLALSGPVPSDGFFVVADGIAGATNVANADLVLDFDFQNGPDSVVLRDPAGGIVDALGYGSFPAGSVFAGEGNAALDPPAGQSLARPFADLDTNDNATDFAPLAEPTPGTGATQVPEPTSAWLFVAALCGVAELRRQRVQPPRTAG